MKKIVLFLFLAISINIETSYCQISKIKIKKDTAFVNGEECLKIKSNYGNCTMNDLDGNDILYSQWFLKTDTHPAYSKIIFLEEKITVTNYATPFSKKNLIQTLISDKVLVECKLNPEKIDLFFLKYNEVLPITINININE
ncbi:MAG: hypothetical protein P8M05_12295 [Flavobacteriales bacterium]|nr:hypothetical protein [Flavobacteriales bacterium]